jgi:hypothetical protein
MHNPSGALARKGWNGPHPLLTSAEALELSRIIRRYAPMFTSAEEFRSSTFSPNFGTRPWFKSLHAYIPELFTLVSHANIVRQITPLLGPDIVAWGTSMTARVPGQAHRWHVDAEHIRWPGATIFIGLVNSERAGLKLINGSHRIPVTPQEQPISTDAEALMRAQQYIADAELSEPSLSDGFFLVLHGRTWHASLNRGLSTRFGLVVQYTTPYEDVAIPLNWDEPIRWHSFAPPRVFVAGARLERRDIVFAPLRSQVTYD